MNKFSHVDIKQFTGEPRKASAYVPMTEIRRNQNNQQQQQQPSNYPSSMGLSFNQTPLGQSWREAKEHDSDKDANTFEAHEDDLAKMPVSTLVKQIVDSQNRISIQSAELKGQWNCR